jgi:hypothetical protein
VKRTTHPVVPRSGAFVVFESPLQSAFVVQWLDQGAAWPCIISCHGEQWTHP